jgi:predicted kinase
MAKVIMLCGKICSGKSTYAQELKNKINAVVLSPDDLMLTLFEEQLGDKHNDILNKCLSYLYDFAEQLINAKVNVILDFGFWYKEERKNRIEYFKSKNIEVEMHYIKIDKNTWILNIEKRNKLVKVGRLKCYYVDENMKELFDRVFEEPDWDENYLLKEMK